MDMNYIDRLLKFGYILTEADNGKKSGMTTDKDRYFRLIEDELKDYFKFPGFELDDSIRMSPEVHLGHGALSNIARQQQEARLNALNAEEPDADEELQSDENGYRLSEFLRVFITGLFVHPSEVGGLGIGNSQTARGVLERIAENPENRGSGGTDGRLTLEMLAHPDLYPAGLKNYIALLSKKFIRGIIRIGFEECGLLPFLLHNSTEILDAVKNGSGGKLDDETIKSSVQSWDYDKLYHLAHNIIPHFVLKAMVAPPVPTPNCDKALIEQNAAYLGVRDLRIIQAYVVPIETGFDTNLCEAGSKTPATYNDMASYAAEWNFSKSEIRHKASHDAQGNANVYTVPEDTPISDEIGQSDSGSLDPRYTTEANSKGAHDYTGEDSRIHREYPSQKLGHWNVVDVDNDQAHCGDNVQLLGKGYTVISGPDGKDIKFWLRGGKDPDANISLGVGNWCWTGSYYNNYRNQSKGDRGYMLIHERALDPKVLAEYKDTDLGTSFDSSAFGVVVAGPGADSIPGLMKPTCFQGRLDSTDYNYRPGAEFEVEYDDTMVPYGGKIPGLIPYGKWDGYWDHEKSKAAAINNSIFCLALIGKWDGSIKVTNGMDTDPNRIQFYTDELLALMQRWFPVDLSGQNGGKEKRKHDISLLNIDDLSTLGRLLSDEIDDDSAVKSLLLSVFQTKSGEKWHLLHRERTDSGVIGCVFTSADDEFRLRSEESKGNITRQEYNEEIGKLPALMFTLDDSGHRFVPFLVKKLTVGEALDMFKAWKSARQRPLAERIGPGTDTPRPDSDNGESIYWLPAMKSAGKYRTVGCTPDGNIWVNGPETDGKPVAVASSQKARTLMDSDAHRGTYVVTPSGEYNIWITAESNSMYIGYVRKKKLKLYRVIGGVLGRGTTNAITNDGSMFSLGDLLGDPAKLNMQNASRYVMYLDLSNVERGCFGDIVDGIGLTETALQTMATYYHGCVGLGVINGNVNFDSGGMANMGVIDWYDAKTLTFVRTTEITMEMLPKTAPKIPRTVTL